METRKWNESGFRPPLCTYRLNWARRTSWGWWDDWDDTVLQTQDSKFEPWRSEAEHATSRSRRLPTILTFTRGWGRNNFVSFKPPRPGTEPRTLAWKAAVLTTTLGPPPIWKLERVVRKRTRKQPSVIASRPFQIWYRSANFLKVLFYITALAIMQHYRDNDKKPFKMTVSLPFLAMGYPCVSPYTLFYMHGPPILLWFWVA